MTLALEHCYRCGAELDERPRRCPETDEAHCNECLDDKRRAARPPAQWCPDREKFFDA